MARLVLAVEDAKHTLTARGKTTVTVELDGHQGEFAITRDLFEELTGDLLERTSYTTRQVLAATGLAWSDIDRVLLVGGSTRMPMVGRMLKQLTGITPDHSVYPDEAVARGAAIFAGYRMAGSDQRSALATFSVTDVNSHSLGIEGIDLRTDRKQNTILIPRNSPLPAKTVEKFSTKKENQRSIIVQVLEGESRAPDQCSPIGRAVLRKLPPGLPKAWPVEVSYEYLTNGRLEVHAKVPGTDRHLLMELEREGGLSAAAIGRWRQVLVSDTGFDKFQTAIADVLGIEESEPAKQPDDSDLPKRNRPKEASTTPPSQSTEKPPRPRPPINPPPARPQAMPAAVARPAIPLAGAVEPQRAPAPRHEDFGLASSNNSRGLSGRLVNLLGHLLAPVLGLIVGYYILVWQFPEANFLNLHLPGLAAPAASPASR
jgi:molecular chaperone DnaK (HSP70)